MLHYQIAVARYQRPYGRFYLWREKGDEGWSKATGSIAIKPLTLVLSPSLRGEAALPRLNNEEALPTEKTRNCPLRFFQTRSAYVRART